MKTKTRMVVTLAALAPLAACAGEAGTGGEWGGTIVDSAGIPVVHNPEVGLWGPDQGWSLEEVFRVGGLDAGDEGQFSLVVGIDADASGRVYVADQQARRIQVFAADGSHVMTLGAPGQGPGEFGPALSGVYVSDTHVRAPDLTNQRVNLFTLDGDPDGSIPLLLTGGVPVRWDETGDGTLAAQLRGMAVEGMAELPLGDPVITVAGGDAEPDTLGYLPKGASVSFAGGRPQIRLFESEPLWDLDGSGRFVSAMNSNYRIEVRRDGVLERIITRPFQLRAVSDREKDQILDMLRDLMLAQGIPPEAVPQVLGVTQFAEHYPAFAQLLLGPDGTLWVQRIQTAEQVAESGSFNPRDLGATDWDVFDAEGRFLGGVEMPQRFQPLRLVGDVLYGIERDEFDVQSVVGVRISQR